MNDGLQVTDLWKSYWSIDVLKGISLHIRPGEIYGFVGANGAGKSTTMRAVIGVTTADAGEVSWLALIQRTEDLHSTQVPIMFLMVVITVYCVARAPQHRWEHR